MSGIGGAGKVVVSAADIALIAAHFNKPIAFFYPPRISVSKDDLSPLSQELNLLFEELPETQQRIALEYVKQQVTLARKAEERGLLDQYAALKSKRRKKK